MAGNPALNARQVAALDRLAEKEPDAIVTGWDSNHHGPIVKRADGSVKVVSPTGYSRILR